MYQRLNTNIEGQGVSIGIVTRFIEINGISGKRLLSTSDPDAKGFTIHLYTENITV